MTQHMLLLLLVVATSLLNCETDLHQTAPRPLHVAVWEKANLHA